MTTFYRIVGTWNDLKVYETHAGGWTSAETFAVYYDRLETCQYFLKHKKILDTNNVHIEEVNISITKEVL